MREVLKILQHLEVSWKIVGAYYVKCVWAPPLPNLGFGSLPGEIGLYDNLACTAAALRSPIKFEAQVKFTKQPQILLVLFLRRV